MMILNLDIFSEYEYAEIEADIAVVEINEEFMAAIKKYQKVLEDTDLDKVSKYDYSPELMKRETGKLVPAEDVRSLYYG
jgi:hypothetical protein